MCKYNCTIASINYYYEFITKHVPILDLLENNFWFVVYLMKEDLSDAIQSFKKFHFDFQNTFYNKMTTTLLLEQLVYRIHRIKLT